MTQFHALLRSTRNPEESEQFNMTLFPKVVDAPYLKMQLFQSLAQNENITILIIWEGLLKHFFSKEDPTSVDLAVVPGLQTAFTFPNGPNTHHKGTSLLGKMGPKF